MADDSTALHSCKQADCPIQANRRASMVQLMLYLGGGIAVSALILSGTYIFVATRFADPPPAPAPPTAASRTVASSTMPNRPQHSVNAAAAPQPRSIDPALKRREREERRQAFAGIDPALVRPSFDCGEAHTASQKLICGDPELSIMDRNTAILFSEALLHSADPRALRLRRTQWESERANLPGNRDAVLDYYENWASELSADSRPS